MHTSLLSPPRTSSPSFYTRRIYIPLSPYSPPQTPIPTLMPIKIPIYPTQVRTTTISTLNSTPPFPPPRSLPWINLPKSYPTGPPHSLLTQFQTLSPTLYSSTRPTTKKKNTCPTLKQATAFSSHQRKRTWRSYSMGTWRHSVIG